MPKVNYQDIYQNNIFHQSRGAEIRPTYLSQLSSMISTLCQRIYNAILSLFEEKAPDLPNPPPPLEGRVSYVQRPHKKARHKRKQKADLKNRVKQLNKKNKKQKKLEKPAVSLNAEENFKHNEDANRNTETPEKKLEKPSIQNPSISEFDDEGIHSKEKEEKESKSKDESLQAIRDQGLSLIPYPAISVAQSIPSISLPLAKAADADSPIPAFGNIHPLSALFSNICYHNQRSFERESKEDLAKLVELPENHQLPHPLHRLGCAIEGASDHVMQCMLPAKSNSIHNFVMDSFVTPEISKLGFSQKTMNRLGAVIHSPEAQQILVLVPKLMSGPVKEHLVRRIFDDIQQSIIQMDYTQTFDRVVICINQHSNKLISIKNRTYSDEMNPKELLDFKYHCIANKILALGFCHQHLEDPKLIQETAYGVIPLLRLQIETFLKNQIKNTARKEEFLEPLLVRTVLPTAFETTLNKFIQMIIQNSKKLIVENENFKTYQDFKAYNSESLDEFDEKELKSNANNPNKGLGAHAFFHAKDQLRDFLWELIKQYYTPFSSSDECQLAIKINALIPELYKILEESPSEAVPEDRGVGNDIMSLVNNLGFELGEFHKGGLRKPIVGNILKQLLKLQTTDEMVKNKIISSLNTYRKDSIELLKQVTDNLIPMFEGSFLDRMVDPNAPQDKINSENVQFDLSTHIERYSELLSQVIAFNTESSIANPVNSLADNIVNIIPSRFGLGILKNWIVSPLSNYVAKPTFNFVNRKVTQSTIHVSANSKDISNLINNLLNELFKNNTLNEQLLVNITDVVVESLRDSALKLNNAS